MANTEITTPIGAVYILDASGIPMFARYYQGIIQNTDSALLGGFFSAIEIFVKTSLDSLLVDIGMTDRRFFFDRTDSGYIIIIIIFSTDEILIDQSILTLVKSLNSTIANCFDILIPTAKNQMIKPQKLIEGLGDTMDSFILETTFDVLEMDELEGQTYTVGSKAMSSESLKTIIEAIKEIKDAD